MSIKGVIFSCKGTKLSSDEKSFFSKIYVFGFILFKRNFTTTYQIKTLINEIRDISKNKNLFFFVDQEGGRVQRFNNKEFLKIPPQNFFGKQYTKNKSLARKLAFYNAFNIGAQLKDVGIDANFSPVLDIKYSYGNKIIGDRSFGDDPKMVSVLGKEYCKGFRASGIFPVLKHFPGHGRAKEDSHLTLPYVNANIKDLKATDLIPFNDLHKEIFIMLAHIVYKNIDQNVATYSSKIIQDLLRKRIGFEGLIITDDLSMQALTGNVKEKTLNSYNAGCDIVLYCDAKLDEMNEIYKFSRKISDEKLDYLYNQKKSMQKVDISNSDELNKLLYK